jgi:hypothetical protein
MVQVLGNKYQSKLLEVIDARFAEQTELNMQMACDAECSKQTSTMHISQ